MNAQRLHELIAGGETLRVEFKSDRQQISDKDIYEELVSLANTEGGALVVGVEDDGTITGAKPRHGRTTEPFRLQAAILNNTVPNINTRVSVVEHANGRVLVIETDPYPEPCATAAGKSLHRTIGSDGKPQSVPFYPRDQRSRRVDLGLLDFSAQAMESATFDSLDPLEFERLRQTIVRLHGDGQLTTLPDRELAKALRLVETRGHKLVPNVAGLLLLGREQVLTDLLPTHQCCFQVIDSQGNVKVNDSFRSPLLRTLHEIESRFNVRNSEQEVAIGLFRVPLPDYSLDGFREAVNNSVLHRDYTRPGAVYIQWQPDHILITNPGGFPEGITLDNLLTHEPKPRNQVLAEACKKINLIEGTARGIDRIYLGQLRYGRPIPDYTRSDKDGVRVILRGGQTSREFAAFVYERDKEGHPLGLDDMIILNALFYERRIDSDEAGRLIQKGKTEGRAVLERLHEQGYVEARGARKGRSYHFAAAVYRRFEMKAEYVRAKGFEPLQQEQMVLEYAKTHGRITRSEAAEMCRLSGPQASRLLSKLAAKHQGFRLVGEKRGAHYVWRGPKK